LVMVPSVMDSPICGITTSVGMQFSLKQLRAELSDTPSWPGGDRGIRIGLYGDLHRAGAEAVRLATAVAF
jgi:hypothetical protein